MTTEFLAENVVTAELAAAVMALSPANPFCTWSYAEAQRAYGREAWMLGLKRAGQLIAGCYGFLASGRMNSGLEIRALPALLGDEVFWAGLMQFCSRHQVTSLKLDTRGAPEVQIPPLPGELERLNQHDYVLDLRNPEWERKLARNHWRNIKTAMESGLRLCRTGGADACRVHVCLRKASMERRQQRGEWVSTNFEDEIPTLPQLIRKGAGELFQAVAGGSTLSSVLVLRAKEGVYLDSTGTSLEGMRCGANHFLTHSIAKTLREESVWTCNFGTAHPNTGLSQFKTQFGAIPVPIQSAIFYLGGDLRLKLTRAAYFLRQGGSAILRLVRSGKIS